MTNNNKYLFSGIQPSGEIHIGNYIGAIKNWVELLDKYNCIFCVVDYHAITIRYDIKTMPQRILDTAIINIACGLDPEKCLIFVQSAIKEHTELAWIFNTVTPMGELNRMTQFKEKSKQHEKNINVGLYDYPVLQAADILLYKAEMVPVGEDQIQHIEFSREIARKFNALYGDTFPEPEAYIKKGARILGLDGKNKMSKSMDNYIGMLDNRETILNKLKGAFTDPQRLRKDDAGNPDICNIFTLHKFFTDSDMVKQIYSDCRTAKIGCVSCKKCLGENIAETIAPIQEKAKKLNNDIDYIKDVLNESAKKCQELATETISEVRQKMGLIIL